MCTSFVHKGKDVIVGFNFDVDPKEWPYKIAKNKDGFFIMINDGRRFRRHHGVNNKGEAGNLFYVKGCEEGKYSRGKDKVVLGGLVIRMLNFRDSFADLVEITKTKKVVDTTFPTLHSLLSNRKGDVLIIEPGRGVKYDTTSPYSLMTNFALFDRKGTEGREGSGVDRYEIATKILKEATDDFGPQEGMALLKATHQEGKWGTKVSFIYSSNEHQVYYVENNDFEHVQTFKLKEE
ncbi:MAG: conjugal transfer protein [Bacilli bacterium]|nr:conjugal transfer protein [Bacilli bacterium]